MNRFVTRLASISAASLLGLAACATEPQGEGGPPAEEGPAAEASEALAGATSCGAFVQRHVNWVQGRGSCTIGAYVDYDIVTHQASGLVSRSRGTLGRATDGFSFYNPFTQTFVTEPSRLFSDAEVDGQQAFSDRLVSATIPGEATSRQFGFDPRAKDQVKVTLDSDGKMVFKLVSWGGFDVVVQPTECMNDLMYGFAHGVLYSVRLTDECAPG